MRETWPAEGPLTGASNCIRELRDESWRSQVLKGEQEVIRGKKEGHPGEQEQHEQRLRGMHIFRPGSR